jgi:phosphohistidine phosphatase
MKKLYLVRHAKSSWEDITLADIDRPLKGTGVSDAHIMATRLKSQNILPELILSSPAVRTISTAIIFARVLNYPLCQISIRQEIYEASPELILQVIEQQYAPASIMILGHDPSFCQLYNRLTGSSLEKIPTTGIATIEIDSLTWNNLLDKTAKGLSLDKPKDYKTPLNKGA